MNKRPADLSASLPWLFLAGRLLLLVSLPLEGLLGYGDFVHFHRLAGMGVPYRDYWVEFPPIFPFISSALYALVGGRLQAYAYLLAAFLSLAQAGSLALFIRLAGPGSRKNWVYLALTLGLAYGWWYFDPLAVFCLLLGWYFLRQGQDGRAGLALAAGALVKWFPLLLLPLAWRSRPPRQAARITIVAAGVTALAWGGLFLAAPENTTASLLSQSSKGSWETVWALIDGNLGTGNFGPELERYEPQTALQPRGNPARLPGWLTLAPFALLGLWLFLRRGGDTLEDQAGFLGLTCCLFFLWLPGWSPQWVLYLLPLVLVALPEREGALAAFVLVLVSLLEWPLLLSRGLSWSLWLLAPLRSCLLVFLAFRFSTHPRLIIEKAP